MILRKKLDDVDGERNQLMAWSKYGYQITLYSSTRFPSIFCHVHDGEHEFIKEPLTRFECLVRVYHIRKV